MFLAVHLTSTCFETLKENASKWPWHRGFAELISAYKNIWNDEICSRVVLELIKSGFPISINSCHLLVSIVYFMFLYKSRIVLHVASHSHSGERRGVESQAS